MIALGIIYMYKGIDLGGSVGGASDWWLGGCGLKKWGYTGFAMSFRDSIIPWLWLQN